MGTVLSNANIQKYVVPPWVKRGDILFLDCKNTASKNEWARPGSCNDHVTLYLGKGYYDKSAWPWHFTPDESGEDWFVESLGCHNRTTGKHINMHNPNGVQINNFSFYFRWGQNFKFGCVVNPWLCRLSDDKIDNVIKFALDTFNRSMIQYHKYNPETKKWSDGNYQVFFEAPHFGVKHNNPYAAWGRGPLKNQIHPCADRWFCAEFVWAAYKNCDDPINFTGKGVDIDENEWRNFDITEDWIFQLWYGVLRWITPQEILWDSNVILSPTLYAIRASVEGNGSISYDPIYGVYENGETVEVTAEPDPGWKFSGWSGEYLGSSNPAVVTFSDQDISVTAHFLEDIK